MRAITKGAEPATLIAYRKTQDPDYPGYGDKAALRASLHLEQHGICCYCMGRIHAEHDKMKVEHWQCQSRYPAEQLRYHNNLLGACLGGHGQPEHLQHCDTKKGDLDLKFNPAEPAHHVETRIRYEMDGRIISDEDEFNDQLDRVLNLNIQKLKANRKGVLAAILKWWKAEKGRRQGPMPNERLFRERARRLADGAGNLAPFDPVVVWWIDQRLARALP